MVQRALSTVPAPALRSLASFFKAHSPLKSGLSIGASSRDRPLVPARPGGRSPGPDVLRPLVEHLRDEPRFAYEQNRTVDERRYGDDAAAHGDRLECP